MANTITLRVLDGADRGRVFEQMRPPITVGREEGNSVQLNDERVSRFHVKIQEDHEKLVLTDLESTNGTKVNGEDIQLRILRYGDMITVGRSVLLFGSRDEIEERLSHICDESHTPDQIEHGSSASPGSDVHLEVAPRIDPELQAKLFDREPPGLPTRLSPGQAAELYEVLEFLHLRLRSFLNSADVDRKSTQVTIGTTQWQAVVDLQARLAEYLRSIGFPDDPKDKKAP